MKEEQLEMLLEYIDARIEEKVNDYDGKSSLQDAIRSRELADILRQQIFGD